MMIAVPFDEDVRHAPPRSYLTGRRLAALIGCLGFALLALGNGLDRESAIRPRLVPYVPDAFADHALETAAQAELSGGHGPAVAALGAKMTARDPIDPTSVAYLAVGRLIAGDAVGADQAFRVAGQMGWRVPITQRYWMAQALRLGDYRVAGERLDAALRQQPALIADRGLMDPMERTAAGRAAIVDRLRLRPDWLDLYAGDGFQAPADIVALRAEILTDLAQTGVRLGCDGIARAVTSVATVGSTIAAARLWRAHCPAAGTGMLADGDFARARLDAAETPFDWQFVGSSDVDINLVPAPHGGRDVQFGGTASIARLVAWQALVVTPGAYRLRWRADAPVAGAARLQPALSCAQRSDAPIDGEFDATAGMWSAPLVLDAACTNPRLAFTLVPRGGMPIAESAQALTLGTVSLTPAPPPAGRALPKPS